MTYIPWTVGPDAETTEEGVYSVWTDVPGAINAEIAGRICSLDHAHLIAATQELLGALKFAARVIEGENLDEALAGEYSIVQDALAKAEPNSV